MVTYRRNPEIATKKKLKSYKIFVLGKILVVTEGDDHLMSEDTRFKDLISKSADILAKDDPIKIFVSGIIL